MCPIVPLIWPLCRALSAVSALNRTKNSIGRSINHNFKHCGRSLFSMSSLIQLWPAHSTGSCCSHINAIFSNRKCEKGPGHPTISSVGGRAHVLNQMLSGNTFHWGFAICSFVQFVFCVCCCSSIVHIGASLIWLARMSSHSLPFVCCAHAFNC